MARVGYFMRYYKQTGNGFIYSIGVGNGGEEITEEEYLAIQTALENKPEATETKDFALRTDLSWEAFEIEQAEPDISDAEAFRIIFEEEAE